MKSSRSTITDHEKQSHRDAFEHVYRHTTETPMVDVDTTESRKTECIICYERLKNTVHVKRPACTMKRCGCQFHLGCLELYMYREFKRNGRAPGTCIRCGINTSF